MRPGERHRRVVPPGQAPTRVPKHRFEPDEAVPKDFWDRRTCAACRCIGKVGDARHFAADKEPPLYPEVAEEVRALKRRRLGEHDDP